MTDTNPALAEALPVLETGLDQVGATDAERERARKMLTYWSELGGEGRGRWGVRELQACAQGIAGRVIRHRLWDDSPPPLTLAGVAQVPLPRHPLE